MRELTKGIIYIAIVALINALIISWGSAVTNFDLSRHNGFVKVPFGYIYLTTINGQTVENPFTLDLFETGILISAIIDVGCLIGYLLSHREILRFRL